ncbi:MAG: energy transducer TonB [Pseudomonadota bacterium]
MKLLRRLAAVLLGAPMAVAAQSPTVEPSIARACLKPAPELRGEPEYPFDAWKRGLGGRVEVELSFRSADRSPSVKVLANEGDDSFVEAVRAHVRQFRLPCIDKDLEQARLVFEYVFKPDDRKIAAADPKDPDHEARRKQVACLVHTSGRKAPDYPPAALRRDLQGRILIDMQFDAADKPPSYKVYSATGAGPLHEALEDWVPGYRLPCFAGPGSAKMSVKYTYLIDGGSGYGFKPLGLMQFLGAVKGIRDQRLDFDFNQMACPFDVRLTYLQPHRRNNVHQLVSYEPSRQPFIDWLRTAELNVPERMLQAVYADEITLTIPCTRINLTP